MNLIKLLDQCLLNRAQTLTESANFLLLSCGRTGWVMRKVPLPESDSDHMHRCAMCAMLLTQPPDPRDDYSADAQRFHPDKAGGCGVMLLGLFVDSNDHWPNDVMSHLSHH